MTREKRKTGGRARDGSGGYFCWSLGQQLFLEGDHIVMAGSTSKARGAKAHIWWAVSCRLREPFLLP